MRQTNQALKSIAQRLKESKPFESAGQIYHPLPFPEFADISTASSAKVHYRKWRLIQESMPRRTANTPLKVLDIGANAGFYTFSFAQQGASVDAYEMHEHYVTLGQDITQAANLDINWACRAFERSDVNNKHYDVALMLSVFQWISEGNKCLLYAHELLRAVCQATKVLYFELGCNHGTNAIHTTERPIAYIWRMLQAAAPSKSIAYCGTNRPWRRGLRHLFVCYDVAAQLSWRQKAVTWMLQHRWIR